MEKAIIVTPKFNKDFDRIYKYLLKEWSAKVAYEFLDKIAQALRFIREHPSLGKQSQRKQGIRSIPVKPHNRIYFRNIGDKTFILSLFDMRQHPSRNPYQ
jgi:plasmid stabilization system protein ParE